MKARICRIYSILIVYNIISVLAACSQTSPLSVNNQTPLPSKSPSIPSYQTMPTLLPSVIYASFTPTTKAPTNIPLTLTPTQTQQPTLSAEDARKLLNELLEDNGGCCLPCFWGITPGKTTWEEALSFLEKFTMIDVRKRPGEVRYLEPLIPFPSEMGTIRHRYRFEQGVVDEIEAYNGDLAPAFYLTRFLNTYGSPGEVWIRAQAIEEQGSQPFEVVLFYPEQGILMDYSGGDLETVGDKLRNCLGDLTSPSIYLWHVSGKISFQEAYERFLRYPDDWPFIALEDATDMDVAAFYKSFKEPGNTACLETPLRLWPGGGP